MMTKQQFFLLAIPFWGSISALFPQKILLEDTFQKSQSAQNLPHSAEWRVNEEAIEQLSGKGLILSGTNERPRALAYFTDQAPIALTDGQTLKLTCAFSVAGRLSEGKGLLRIGLFDSQGHRIAPGVSPKDFDYSGYQGYALSANLLGSRTGKSLSLIARNGDRSGSLFHVEKAWTRLGEGGGHITWAENEEYVLDFSIRRQTDAILLTASITGLGVNGEEVIASDTTLHCTQFDTIAFTYVNGAVFEKIRFFSVNVQVDSGF